jgi:hypothetical protein
MARPRRRDQHPGQHQKNQEEEAQRQDQHCYDARSTGVLGGKQKG